MKTIGALLLVGAIAIVGYLGFEFLTPKGGFDAENFKAVWTRDIEFLKEKEKLHPGFDSLKMVEFSSSDENVRVWLDQFKPDFGIKSEGLYKLEVLIDTWAENREQGVMIQYHIVSLSSGDTIWELGRTLTLVK